MNDANAKMLEDQIAKMLTLTSKSNVIRYLASKSYTRSQIAKMLNIRYQHVKNVLDQECKRLDISAEIEKLESQIVESKQLDLFGS